MKIISHREIEWPGLSNIEQVCQESLIQGKIPIQQNWHEGLKYL